MRKSACYVILSLLLATPSLAQTQGFRDPLLDRLAGRWVMRGRIAGAEVTHDIDAAWVLGHYYMRVFETSRETTAAGEPEYEAIVLVGWDESTEEYACLWLDNTGGGGLSSNVIGRAKREGDAIPFVFGVPDGSVIYNTFAYDRNDDAWTWAIDTEREGIRTEFARVALTKN